MKYSINILANIVFPVTLLVIAAVIIFYQFPAIPQNVALDEVEFIRLAKALDGQPYTPYTTLATGHATMYFYMLLASIKAFGETAFAVRFPSALFGVINALLMYGVFRLVFEKRESLTPLMRIYIPFILAFAFISMRWYFNFARFGFEATTVLMFELAGIYALFLYHKTKQLKYILLTGLAAGLAYNSYMPGRLFFIIPGIFLLFETGIKPKLTYASLRKLLYFIIPFILLTIPLNAYFRTNEDTRIYQLFFLQNEQLSISEKAQFLWQNVTRLTEQFFIKGDMNGRHNYPGKSMLNPIQALLFAWGLVIALFNIRNNYYHRFFLLFFVIGMLPPMMTYPWENPNALRSVTVLPSVAYFMGIALLMLLRLPFPKKWIMASMFCIIALSAIYELRTYFVFQRTVFIEAFEINPNFIQPYLKGNYFLDPNKPQPEL